MTARRSAEQRRGAAGPGSPSSCGSAPGAAADLAHRDTGWVGGADYEELAPDELDDTAKAKVATGVERARRRPGAAVGRATRCAVLVVFQAMDAAGKDSTIKHVMSGVNPQGVDVVSFRHPDAEELDHPFLWRTWQGRAGEGPDRHLQPLALRGGRRPAGAPGVARRAAPPARRPRRRRSGPSRYADINAFEQHLDRTGVTTVKFFLNVSKEEQKRRFLRRLDRPHKEWKFNADDIAERGALGRLHGGLRAGDHARPRPRGRRGT